MIPQRVRLKGFLCYQDEQEVGFDGASLWLLAGLNGSGKSTVFDAVTYALFGEHRGGSQDAHELINKDSDKASVEFDFALDGRRYQAYRTIQRTKLGKSKSTLQLYRYLPDGTKEPVPDTNLRKGFDEWVQRNIGLSYDVFTSSVLLLQGKAERLLDAKPKERFEVLAGIVDLDRFERLHGRAVGERDQLRHTSEALRQRLALFPVVTPLERAAADAAITDAEEERQRAQAEVERLQAVGFLAQKWAEVQARLAVAHQRWGEAQKLLGDAESIERDVTRLAELRDVLPRVQTVVEQRSQVQKSDADSQEYEQRRQRHDEQRAGLDHALAQARQKLAALKQRTAADEQRQRDVSALLRQAGAALERVKEYERHEHDLEAIRRDLARMPAEPKAAAEKARQRHDELAAVAGAVPLLARLHAQREQLRQAREREAAAGAARDATRAQGEELRGEAERLRAALDAAASSAQKFSDEATARRTLLDQARRQLDELGQLGGERVCRHCGQTLTEAHLREETARRQTDVAKAEAAFRGAWESAEAARREEQTCRQRLAEQQARLQEAREAFKEHRLHAEQAAREAERAQAECGHAWSELAEPYRNRVSLAPPADWLLTTFPAEADLDELRRQAAELKTARRRMEDAEKVFVEWNTFKGQETAVKGHLDRLQVSLPADRQKVRSDYARLEAEEKALDASLRVSRLEADTAQKELDHLTRERGQAERHLSELKGKLEAEEMARQLCRQTLRRAMQELPAHWHAAAERAGTADLYRWRTEYEDLAQKGTEERGRQLEQARARAEGYRHDLAVLEEEAADVPAEARQDPAHLAALLTAARETADRRADALSEARQRRRYLDEQCQERERLERQLIETDHELAHAKLLADLLGRDRLQLHLVRQAERQVVDYANAVLDRLSGGQLFLQLCGEAGGEGNTAKALELEAHNRVTGEKPINVAFLSGSQKFRVAVSLALGLGQYASRQHRPIESVIIDEGFGCLDKEGRQAMIQELHGLRGQLRCILLVSHQEEFAEAFADGYRFELAGGATKVTRFQR